MKDYGCTSVYILATNATLTRGKAAPLRLLIFYLEDAQRHQLSRVQSGG